MKKESSTTTVLQWLMHLGFFAGLIAPLVSMGHWLIRMDAAPCDPGVGIIGSPLVLCLQLVLGLALFASLWLSPRGRRLGVRGLGLVLGLSSLLLVDRIVFLSGSWGFSLSFLLSEGSRKFSGISLPAASLSGLTLICILSLSSLALLSFIPPKPAPRRVGRILAGVGCLFSATVVYAQVLGISAFAQDDNAGLAWLPGLGFLGLSMAILGMGSIDSVGRFFELEPAGGVQGARTLRRLEKRLLLVLIFLSLGIVGTGYGYLHRQKTNQHLFVARSLEAIANLKSEQLNNWFESRLVEAGVLRRSPSLRRAAQAYLVDPKPEHFSAALANLSYTLLEKQRYARLEIWDSKGRQILSMPEGSTARDPQLEKAVAEQFSNPGIRFFDLHADSDGGISLQLLIPLFASNEETPPPVAVLAMSVDPNTHLFPMLQAWPMSDASAETLLGRIEGSEVVLLNYTRFLGHHPFSLRRPAGNPDLPMGKAARGQYGISEGLDYRGERVIIHTSKIPLHPWLLVTKIDVSDAYLPIRREAWLVSLAVFAMLVASGLAAAMVWRQSTNLVLRDEPNAERLRQVQEHEIVRLNQLNEALVDVGQRIVRSDDPTVLCQEVCDCLVRVSSIQLVWIARFEPKTQHIVSVGCAGEFCVLAPTLGPSFDGVEGLGIPTLVALREGRVDFCSDPSEERILPWREFLLQHGFASVVAFPIRRAGQTWASLTVFSDKTDIIHDKERAVLEEASNEISFALDVLDQREKVRRAGEILKESEARYRRLTQAVTDYVYSVRILGQDKVQTTHGAGCLDVTGYSVEEFNGDPDLWLRMVFDDDRPRVLEQVGAILQNKELHPIEHRIVCKNGSIRWVANTASIQRDAAGTLLGYDGLVQDITERKLAELKLEELVRERTRDLEASNKELEAFSYSVSHDLRAPLRAIDGFATILSEDYAKCLDEQGRELLDHISSQSQKMGTLIDDLLAFSKLGRQSLNPCEVDLQALATEVRDELMVRESDRTVEWILRGGPQVVADPVFMRQVLINIMGNSLKYTRRKPSARIEVWTEAVDEGVVCHVKDNGAGFDMRYADKLFGVFQRLHNERDFEGHGVGLALVQRIINRHQGRIWAEARVEEGACFSFLLPGRGKNS